MAGITELGDENADWDHMIEIPHKKELELGQSLVFEFLEVHLPNSYDRVRHMFRRKGAYSHFKEFLLSNDLLETWYRFEHEREQKALRSWCEENQIPVSD